MNEPAVVLLTVVTRSWTGFKYADILPFKVHAMPVAVAPRKNIQVKP